MTSSRTWILAGCGAALVTVVVALSLRLRSVDPSGQGPGKEAEEKPLDRARTILAQSGADLDRCRSALSQVNSHLRKSPDEAPAKLTPARTQALRQQIGLRNDELAELDSPTFTPLDGPHLDLCFLLRDAARSLEVRARDDRRPTPLQEAQAAFAWVVRQIQLVNSAAEMNSATEGLASEFVLRRGYGSPLARALVFLGLLQQFGHDGCLLAFPPAPGKPARYWACGLLGKDNRIYLFDPRLGLPLPGSGGKVATLGDVQQKDSPVLARLAFGKDAHYDVTPEQAAASEVHLMPSLSALAPRMRLLEKLLAPAVKVKLTADPEAMGRFEKALKASGHKAAVKLAPWAVRLQRGFYPPGDGGIDNSGLKKLAESTLVQRHHLARLFRALPESVASLRMEQWNDPPLNMIGHLFRERFESLLMKGGRPRDQILRGRLEDAGRELGLGVDRLQEQDERFLRTYDPREIGEWFDAASKAIARRQGQQVIQAIFNKYARALTNLVEGASARPRLAQAAFLQALCKQEMAEHEQFFLDCFPDEVTEEQCRKVEDLWKETRSLWLGFRDRFNDPSAAQLSPAARAALARAHEMVGEAKKRRAGFATGADRTTLLGEAADTRATAAVTWENLARFWEKAAGEKTVLPALACRFEARRLSK